MTIVTIHKAKTTLSQLIKRAAAGEVIEIARGDKVVAKIIPDSAFLIRFPRKNCGFGKVGIELAARHPCAVLVDHWR
jgi:antitoxin (DNA-binding transcriptional repressor) of toxin-antitoxin stability system